MSLTCVECFAGAGGAALGLHAAGLQHRALVEWDADACGTLRAAIAAGQLDGEVIEGDVRGVDWDPFVGVDVLWASFPCQCWSVAGKRLGAKDERNGWPWTVAAVDALGPRWLLAENVPGLTHHRAECDGRGGPEECPGCYFARCILPDLEARFASVQWAILDAADFGVPQHRRRVYLVAGPQPIRWPAPTHAAPADLRQVGLFAPRLAPHRTVREALGLDASLRPERGRGMAARYGERRDHPSDEPAPQVGAGSAGSGPRMQVVLSDQRGNIPQSRRPLNLDAPTDTVQAGSPTADHAPVIVTTSRSGRARLEYPLNAPKHSRGPSDAVRRHQVEVPELPSSGIGCSRPTFLLDPKHPPAFPDAPASTVRSGGNGHSEPPLYLWQGDIGGCGYPQSADAPAPALVAKGTATMGPAPAASRAGSRPELLDAPSPVVTAREHKGTTVTPNTTRRASDVQCASDAIYLGAGIRRLSVDECRILMGWPDGWPLQGTQTERYRQVGNGCCPPVVEAIARAVLAADALQSPRPAADVGACLTPSASPPPPRSTPSPARSPAG